jgi:hypothetical protein
MSRFHVAHIRLFVGAVVLGASVILAFSNVLASHALTNRAGILAARGLLGTASPDETTLEAARQAYYQAMDHGRDLIPTLERLRDMEAARWSLISRNLAEQGQSVEAEHAFTYDEWTRTQFDQTILAPLRSASALSPTSHSDPALPSPDWSALGQAAARMQLWSLSAYFYDRGLRAGAPEAHRLCLGLGEALLRLGQAGKVETTLTCSAAAAANDLPRIEWLRGETLAAQGRCREAAPAIETVAKLSPSILETAEGAALVSQVERYAALNLGTDIRAALERQTRNQVTNGGFEAGYRGWGMWPEPGSDSTFDDTAYSGLRSIRVQFDGSRDVNYYQVFQVVPVQPDRTYQLSAWMRADAFTGHLGIEVRSQDGVWFGGNTLQVHGSTDGWQRVTLNFSPPAGVTEVALTLRRYNGHGLVSGTVWVDEVVLLEETARLPSGDGG